MAFSLKHQVGSKEWTALNKFFHDRERIKLKGCNVDIGLVAITGIDTDMSTNISTFHFTQVI